MECSRELQQSSLLLTRVLVRAEASKVRCFGHGEYYG